VRILLDTDMVSYLMRNQYEELWHQLDRFDEGDVGMSAISAAELRFGLERTRSAKNLKILEGFKSFLMVMPFDDQAAKTYGGIRSSLERQGTPIGPLDTLIAAHAITLDVPLATNNVREFRRVPGLRVENWLA
jgi:tRNA(fMet)-specific endonuclease VapC